MNALSFFSELTTHGDPLDANSQRALQLKQFGALFASEKCGCNTVFPCTAGASNPVDEVFRHVRQVIIDDVGDFLDVDAARGKVRSHQHFNAPLLKACEG